MIKTAVGEKNNKMTTRLVKASRLKRVTLNIGLLILVCFALIGEKTWGAAADYAGVYSGKFYANVGNDHGYWTADLKSDGNVQMIVWSFFYDSGLSGLGTVDQTGNFFAINTVEGFSANGAIDPFNNVKGTYNLSGDDGTFVGGKSGVTQYLGYVGTYKGTYSGDYEGTWIMCVEADGRITGSTYNPQYNVTEQLNGAFVVNNEILAYSKNSAFYAQFDSGVTVTGNWYRADDKTQGTFEGLKTSDTIECNSNSGLQAADGGGGGGGGCFITTVIQNVSKMWFRSLFGF